jgi:hypothetical protein
MVVGLYFVRYMRCTSGGYPDANNPLRNDDHTSSNHRAPIMSRLEFFPPYRFSRKVLAVMNVSVAYRIQLEKAADDGNHLYAESASCLGCLRLEAHL